MFYPPALTPAFPWFGDGSDGELVVTADYPIEVQEDIGHIFKQYTSLHIQNGGTLRPSARCAGMVILVQGDCTIDAGGSINMDKMAPRRSDNTEAEILTTGPSAPWLQKIGSLTGGAGGTGGSGRSPETARGGAGGTGHPFGGGYGGGGGAGSHIGTGYSGGASEPRPPVSVEWPFPANSTEGNSAYGAGGTLFRAGSVIRGGAAPGGSGADSDFYSHDGAMVYRDKPGIAGDAYGGGLVLLVVGGNLSVAGAITANAGNGADARTVGGATGGGPGGGGGGGIVAVLVKGVNDLNGSITANGGLSGVNHHYVTVAAQNGSIGTVYIHQVDDELNVVT